MRKYIVIAVVLFIANTGAVEENYAFAENAAKPELINDLTINRIKIPQHLGNVKEQVLGVNGKYIIHINDEGKDYQTQQKIGDLVQFLTERYKIDLISLEGGSGAYDLSLFGTIKDTEIKKKISEYLLRTGVVNGPEYFAINHPEKADLFGIEKEEYFILNLEYYKEALKNVKNVRKFLKDAKSQIARIKKDTYGPVMNEIDEQKEMLRADNEGRKKYLIYLFNRAGLLDAAEKKNIFKGVLYDKLIGNKPIAVENAKKERNSLLSRILAGSDTMEAEMILKEIIKFSNGKMDEIEFYTLFFDLARSKKIDIREYPVLFEYETYLREYGKCDITALYKEERKWENRALKELATEKELAVYCLDRDFGLLEKMTALSISEAEYAYYDENKNTFSLSTMRSRITALGGKELYLAEGAEGADAFRSIEKFYSCINQRKESFVENIENKLDAEDEKGTILITSGYHSTGLSRVFKDKGYTYIEICPSVYNGTQQAKKANNSDQEGSFSGTKETYTLSAASLFSELSFPEQTVFKEKVKEMVMGTKDDTSNNIYGVMDIFCRLFIVDAAASTFKGYTWHETIAFIAKGILPLFEHLEEFTAAFSGEDDYTVRTKVKTASFLRALTAEEKDFLKDILLEYIASKEFLDQVREALPGVLFQIEQHMEAGNTKIDAFDLEVKGFFNEEGLSKAKQEELHDIIKSVEYNMFLDDINKTSPKDD